MNQEIIDLYDAYTHRPLSRETFLKKLALITGSMVAALGILPLLEGNYAIAQTSPTDKRLHTERVLFEVAGAPIHGYLAKPHKHSRLRRGGIVVIHENRGLNAHIEDICRRVALAGYIALAPDGLSTLGGTPTNEDQARELFSKLDAAQSILHFSGAVSYLAERKDCNGAVGCLGFCWGGAMANQLAVQVPKLKAAVAYYGRQPDMEAVSKISAAIQLHYAGLDERINAGMSAFETALIRNHKIYEQYVYENAQHAFNNNTSAARFNKEAAELAWQRSLAFFAKYVHP